MEDREFRHERIIVMDFGGRNSQLIARRIRDLSVYCEVVPYDTSIEKIKALKPKGIILSGGPSSVFEPEAPQIDQEIYTLGFPVLGISYGAQLMATDLGGKIEPGKTSEHGRTCLISIEEDVLFTHLPQEQECWVSHGDYIKEPPEGFEIVARTQENPVAAMSNQSKNLFGLQFHPEVKQTPYGQEMLKNFVFDVCGCEGDWSMEDFIKEEVEKIRAQVGDKKVVCGLSGGVDSSVAAALVHRAIGDQLTSIFVDHGLMRYGEADEVCRTFGKQFEMSFIYADEKERFLSKLQGVTDPEQKRKIIGEEFIRVFEDEARKLGNVDFLVQGTLYSDVIESGTETAQTIKSHHNVGGLPEDMELELIEPLRNLFKDEVRQVGEALGLPHDIVWRQPFPGPGLAIRIAGAVTPEKVEIVQAADVIVRQEVDAEGLSQYIWQGFAILLDVKAVGVMEDKRTYGYPVVVRTVTSEDAMTADWAKLPHEVLERISARILNEVNHVSRVLYDITAKPPGTIEWE